MLTCALTAIFATMTYPATLWTICEYRCPKEISRDRYDYPYKLAIPYGEGCPRKYTFEE
jgi:hypothetical protein